MSPTGQQAICGPRPSHAGHCAGAVQGLASLLFSQPGKKPALDHLCLLWPDFGQSLQGLVHRQPLGGLMAFGGVGIAQFHMGGITATLFGQALAGVVAEQLAHDARGQVEKMGPVVDLELAAVDKAHIALMDQAGSFKGVAAVSGFAASGKLSQIDVQQGHHPIQSGLIAAACSLEQGCQFTGHCCAPSSD
jgi:hypothetical protein